MLAIFCILPPQLKLNTVKRNSNEEVFFNDGYQLIKSEIAGKPDKDTIFRAITKMYKSVDQLIDSLLKYAETQGKKAACYKGCEWCCHQAVYANSYEIHFLSEYIKTNFQKVQIEQILNRAKNKNQQVKKLSEAEVLKYKSPCSLLIDGACMAYEARPMACRIYLSTKLESCLKFYHQPEDEKNYPALLDFPLMAGRMMNEGFIEALKEKEIGTAEFRLEEGLSITLEEGWLEPNALK